MCCCFHPMFVACGKETWAWSPCQQSKPVQVFLFNHSDRTLLGPLSAVSPGGMYLDERAWARPGHRSPWPAQVTALRICHVPADLSQQISTQHALQELWTVIAWAQEQEGCTYAC